MDSVNRKWYSGMLGTEDWWAVWLGLFMFSLGLLSIWGIDAVGWFAKTKTWVWGADSISLLKPAGNAYKGMGQIETILATYAVFTAMTCTGAYFMKLNVKRFFMGWTVLFAITWAAWTIGHEAHFKALKAGPSITQSEIYGDDVYCTTKVQKCTKQINKALKKLGVEDLRNPDPESAAKAVDMSKNSIRMSWGLQLGGGFSYILALVIGLFIGNFVKPLAGFIKEAAKPEWFIKTAIVYLGIKVGLMSMKAAGFAFDLAIAGAAATFVAYLLFWPIIYAMARKWFKLPRQWAAVLCSGISICGVSAAIATGGAIRAKPIIAIMVSMLVVLYAMIELLVLPGFYTAVAPDQPIVNGAAMGMTVKTDGADAAAGAILDELMRANASLKGVNWEEGWILVASIMTKIWIDMFIGVWAFVLAIIWVYKVERQPGQATVGASEIWFRFPKFVIGYIFCWFAYVAIAAIWPDIIKEATVGANVVQSPMRKFMFMITFVAMGCVTDFSKLRGMGRLALLYGVALVFIIGPIAYGVAWIFHHGMMPPIAS